MPPLVDWTLQTGAGGQDAKQDFVDGPKRPAYCENATQFYGAPRLRRTFYPPSLPMEAEKSTHATSCRLQ